MPVLILSRTRLLVGEGNTDEHRWRPETGDRKTWNQKTEGAGSKTETQTPSPSREKGGELIIK